jgi:hypothetical protein
MSELTEVVNDLGYTSNRSPSAAGSPSRWSPLEWWKRGSAAAPGTGSTAAEEKATALRDTVPLSELTDMLQHAWNKANQDAASQGR